MKPEHKTIWEGYIGGDGLAAEIWEHHDGPGEYILNIRRGGFREDTMTRDELRQLAKRILELDGERIDTTLVAPNSYSALVERWKESALMCDVYVEDAESIGATATAMANRWKKEAFVQCARELSAVITPNGESSCREPEKKC